MRVKHLGLVDYHDTWQAMKAFTKTRETDTEDELWVLEHPPVFTQGQAGKPEHVLNPHAIPIVQSDRGGQVTYHGPGQLIIYCLIDIARLKMHVRDLVTAIETALIDVLTSFGVNAAANPKAPGVYVDGAKIASLGLRIHKGRSYHGLSFNVDMDLTPFSYINPCGLKNQAVTSLALLEIKTNLNAVATTLTECLLKTFNAHDACDNTLHSAE
jgi:lipoyl(octanoyl) transferase